MNILIEASKMSVATMKINNIYVHSKYNPLKEADSFIEKQYEIGKTHIIYGFGLGYIVDRLKEKRKADEKIVVIDPFINIDREDSANVFYLDKRRQQQLKAYLTAILDDKDSSNIKVVCSINYQNVDLLIHEETMEVLAETIKAIIINYNTIMVNSWGWYRNLIDNLKYAMNDLSIKVLYDKYACPVVVAAGGPSLSKQLPLLKKIANKCIIICAGSTIGTLLKNDIKPDYIVNVDGGQMNLQHYEKLKGSHIHYIYGLQSTEGIRSNFSGSCFYFSAYSEPLSEAFKTEVLPNVDKIEGGVTVASYALMIASLITSGPVALIGQDLAYTNGLSHAEGNVRNEKKELNEDYFYKKIIGYDGNEIFSDVNLIAMKHNIEQVLLTIKEKQLNQIYNCTEGGAKIQYVEQVAFEAFVEQFLKEDLEKNLINFEASNSNFRDYREFLNSGIEKLNIRVKNLKSWQYKMRSNNYDLTNLKKEISKCNKLVNELNLQVIVNMISVNMNKQFPKKVFESKLDEAQYALDKNKFVVNEFISMFETTSLLFNEKIEGIN